jgi:DNA-binding LacI/PurR family transcriptional regulator
VSTVSLVLSNKAKDRRISAEVHARVLLAAKELDYSPNLLVRSMQRGRTHVLSFFNGFRFRRVSDLYMDQLSASLERAAGAYGYDILVQCDFSRSVEETYRFLNGGRADGLLMFAPLPDDPLLPYLRSSRLPTVLINMPDTMGVLPCVKDDMEDGMRQIAECLVKNGHKRISAITNEIAETRLRLAALRRYLEGTGVTIPERFVFRQSSRAALEQILTTIRNDPEPPTALFSGHDFCGYTLMELCDSHGVQVPEQLALVGYDGLRWPTSAGRTLDSVHVDLDALAEAAVVTLDSVIAGKEVAFEQLLPVQLRTGTTLVSHVTSEIA